MSDHSLVMCECANVGRCARYDSRPFPGLVLDRGLTEFDGDPLNSYSIDNQFTADANTRNRTLAGRLFPAPDFSRETTAASGISTAFTATVGYRHHPRFDPLDAPEVTAS